MAGEAVGGTCGCHGNGIEFCFHGNKCGRTYLMVRKKPHVAFWVLGVGL